MSKDSKKVETKQCTTPSIRQRLSKVDQEELQKCKDSPVYFS